MYINVLMHTKEDRNKMVKTKNSVKKKKTHKSGRGAMGIFFGKGPPPQKGHNKTVAKQLGQEGGENLNVLSCMHQNLPRAKTPT